MKFATAKKYLMKVLALFAVIRGYNVAVLVLAMCLTAYFIFSKDTNLYIFFSNREVLAIVLATAFTVSGGYIINNFYDLDKDRIGRPVATYVAKFVDQNLKLSIYVVFNVIALFLAAMASWRVVIFFLGYQVLVWFYSHKINKIVFVNNLVSTFLYMMPFLALFLYYNNYTRVVFAHGIFLGFNLLALDVSKDFISIKADAIYGYSTLPVKYGKKKAKLVLSLLLLVTAIMGIWLGSFSELGHMTLYFRWVVVVFFILSVVVFFTRESWQYHLLHYTLKIILGIGVVSIAWIKINPLDLQKLIEVGLILSK